MEKITVIGVGKLGLGFALLLEKSGYNVLGVDIFQEYVNKLNEKSIKFSEPGYDVLLQNATNFQATTDLQQGLDHSNIIFILVQTPNGGGTKFYDHTILSNLLEKINKLSGYTFTRINDSYRSTGLIAQEVQSVLPEVVDKVGMYHLGVAYGNMMGLVVEAIKELTTEIQTIKTHLNLN